MNQPLSAREKTFNIDKLDDLKKVTNELAKKLHIKTVILLDGPLAAGKTQFAKFLIEALAADHTEGQASSPSFSLENIYQAKDFIIHHFDLYRLESEDEIESSGLWDAFAEPAVILIEWADRLSDQPRFPRDWKLWKLKFTVNKERRLTWIY